MGASRTRHSLCPLFILGQAFLANLGRHAPRECELAPRLASEAKQPDFLCRSGLLRGAFHRVRSRDPVARNEVDRCWIKFERQAERRRAPASKIIRSLLRAQLSSAFSRVAPGSGRRLPRSPPCIPQRRDKILLAFAVESFLRRLETCNPQRDLFAFGGRGLLPFGHAHLLVDSRSDRLAVAIAAPMGTPHNCGWARSMRSWQWITLVIRHGRSPVLVSAWPNDLRMT